MFLSEFICRFWGFEQFSTFSRPFFSKILDSINKKHFLSFSIFRDFSEFILRFSGFSPQSQCLRAQSALPAPITTSTMSRLFSALAGSNFADFQGFEIRQSILELDSSKILFSTLTIPFSGRISAFSIANCWFYYFFSANLGVFFIFCK